ncbi:MAG: DUF2764 family protein [Marinilabiliaceae bacterium]|nr:DUF2764 family protein [Marinilabiliaceae bacterium]
MIERNYYCLVAGLPDWVIDDKKLPVSAIVFRNYLSEELHPADYKLVQLLFLPFDHKNIISLIYNKNDEFDERGLYTKEEISYLLDKKELEMGLSINFPRYIVDVVSDILLCDKEINEYEAGHIFVDSYYSYVLQVGNSFIQTFASYEITVRNIFAALNGRKFDVNFENDLIGHDVVTEALKKSRSRDFGLATDVDNLDLYFQIFEMSNILDREMKLDTLKWAFIDEITFFDYFNINKILGSVVKLLIAERWFNLDAEKGKQLFEQLLKDLETSYEFPEEFKLSHGKKR